MRMFLRGLALASFWLASPAMAQQVAAANPDSVATALRAKGYQAELTKQSDGDPMIRSASSGAKFVILFMGCSNNHDCTTVQFYAGFKAEGSPATRMNEWNRTKRFARGYIDNEGDPVVEMDLDLDVGGMSTALFQANVDTWVSLLDSFRSHISK